MQGALQKPLVLYRYFIDTSTQKTMNKKWIINQNKMDYIWATKALETN